MAPKKFTYTPGTGGGARTKALAKKGAASKSKKPAWTPPKQPTISARREENDTVVNYGRGFSMKPQGSGTDRRTPLEKVSQTGGAIADFIFPEKTAGKIVKRQPLDAEDYLALASLVPVPGVKAVGAAGKTVAKGAKAVAKPAPAYAASKATLGKSVEEAAKIAKSRDAAKSIAATVEAGTKASGIKPIDSAARTTVRKPVQTQASVNKQRRAGLEKIAEKTGQPRTKIGAERGNVVEKPEPKKVPPAKFPKGKKYKTEAPGRTKPLTDKEKNEIKDLMMPDNIPGMSQSNARAVTGRTRLSYAESEAIKQKEEAAAEAIKAKNAEERAARAARGELRPSSRGILTEPQTLEDTMSKFPKPKPKPTKTNTDRARAGYKKRLDAWTAERDAWLAENTPARFAKKPQPESPLSNVAGKKPTTAADEIPKRPADSKFKSRTAPAAVTKMKPEDWEIRAFTKSGKRMAADVPYQNALDKLTGKTPLDYGKKSSGKGKAVKAEKPVAETPAAETPKPAKPAKPAAPAAEKPATPASKKPSAKKPKPAEEAAKETPAAKKPATKKEEAAGARPKRPTAKQSAQAQAAREAYDAALKSGDPGRIRAARAKWSEFKKTKQFKIAAGSIAGASGALGVGGAIVGQPPGAKSNKATGAKETYQAGTGMGMFSIAQRNKARADKAAAAEVKNPKKFGAAGESKFLKGRSAVRQSVIDQINKQGMAKSLAAVKSRKNDPEYLEAIRRYYGAKRLKQALKG